LQYPVANVKVTLYISDNQTGPWTKYTLSTNPLTTDVNGVTGNWDVTDYLNKWARFVISSGDEDIHQIAS
jgi:hypothetical protein